jgi:hypothetical protein
MFLLKKAQGKRQQATLNGAAKLRPTISKAELRNGDIRSRREGAKYKRKRERERERKYICRGNDYCEIQGSNYERRRPRRDKLLQAVPELIKLRTNYRQRIIKKFSRS